MKKCNMLLIALLIFALAAAAQQAPQKINYQTVVRNAGGAPVINQNVSLRFSILEGSAGGATLYTETHATTTNAFGLATVQLGAGTPVTGTFAAITWNSAAKFLKIEADITGGNNYTDLSTVEMVSTPYALYAGSAGGAPPTGAAGGNLTGTYPNPTIANNAVTNAKISSGTAPNGQVLTADGNGNTAWQAPTAGGGNTVGFSAYLSFYPQMSTSYQLNGYSVNSPYYSDGNFNIATGVYTVPSAGTYAISAVVNYTLTGPVTNNIGAGQFPSFEVRTVSPPNIMALGYIPVFNINYSLTIGTLPIRAPLEGATVNVTGTVVLAAGDQLALYYNNDGMTLPVQIFYSSFAIRKL
ncbi:hypothetical protein [Taibaiella koreensis]|uniref:hypothetical protein n=1 Tax=Taibaiella koreensis TaxID=1268548 RepID=UPI0013C2EBC8|nr:hypothetical protein [Taibaiella koreensis]